MSDQPHRPDWNSIDTVFLDMDGTLLDLYFDNHFWLEHIPKRYAEKNGWSLEEASRHLEEKYHSKAGTLDWYCIDYWGSELGMDILTLKEEVEHLIRFHPHVEAFLSALHRSDKFVVLVTNAHPGILSFKLERVPMGHYFDALESSHEYGLPKEEIEFWKRLQQKQPFNPARTLFIDDSQAVLDAAKAFGIMHLLGISAPDSRGAVRQLAGVPTIRDFSELTPP
ncbi:MAG: GMP/IMP nucleotidase [Gammaproteobacteria bacterium]|jgi:5'-nucleotidase